MSNSENNFVKSLNPGDDDLPVSMSSRKKRRLQPSARGLKQPNSLIISINACKLSQKYGVGQQEAANLYVDYEVRNRYDYRV